MYKTIEEAVEAAKRFLPAEEGQSIHSMESLDLTYRRPRREAFASVPPLSIVSRDTLRQQQSAIA
jgi:hypothetical protein